MNKIAKFEKVSFEQFKTDYTKWGGDFSDEFIKDVYDKIKLPTRSTNGSAGYDFHCTINRMLNHGNSVIIPTGIRAKIDNGWVLMCCPRSSYGFKYGMKLDNTVGIIDSDYYYSDNEGHIMAKVSVDMNIIFNIGDRFMQGLFLPYGITIDDNTDTIRNGGLGSSGK